MTTNQTIDGVPRDFFELALNLCHLLGIPPAGPRAKELRALLDAPVNPLSEIEVLRAAVKELEAMRDARVDAKLAQAEPVAHTMKTVMQAFENAQALHLPGTSNFCAVMAKHLNKYAEQTAPVAVVPEGQWPKTEELGKPWHKRVEDEEVVNSATTKRTCKDYGHAGPKCGADDCWLRNE